MKAKIARLLASVLATVTVMSGMTPCVAYAQTPDEVIEAESGSETEIIYIPVEETGYADYTDNEPDSEPAIVGVPVGEEPETAEFTDDEPDSEPAIVGVPVGEEPETAEYTDNEPDSAPAIVGVPVGEEPENIEFKDNEPDSEPAYFSRI